MKIKVGDFVTCPYTAHVCVVLNIEKSGKTKIESIIDKHTYGCSVKDLWLLQEQDIDPEIGTKVIYDNQLWDIFGKLRTNQKDGKWNVFHLQNVDTKELLFEIEREQFTIYNPVTEFQFRFVDLPVEDKVETKFMPVITTGSFVYHEHIPYVGVVVKIEGENYRVQDLVQGYEYITYLDDLRYIREQDIKLVPGMKIIYEGFVGTIHKIDDEIVHLKNGISGLIDEYEIFNPYFHDYEEKNGLKVLKLRDFIDTPLKSFNEDLYFMGVDPFQNEEPLECSTSFSVGELKKGIEYKDFVKMAENDIETRTIETNFGKVTFVGEDLFKMDSDYKGPALTSFDFAEFDHGEGSEDDVTYEQEVFEYKAGYSEEIDERNLLLNSLIKLQSYLDQLDPNANFSNEDFCKGISNTLSHSIAINFINKVIVRKYGQKVVLKLIFNGYSTQISFTISTREDSENYVVKLLVFDNFKCKESFTGCLASAYKYFANLISSQDLNKSLFDKPDENPFDEELPFSPIEQNAGLKQSEGKLMVQELYWPFIEQMARVMTINKEKYPPKNYMKPMDKEELLAAAQRHQLSIWLGEEIDPTDGQPHAVKVATNMMMYYCQCKLYPDA